jgi:DNA repair protein RadC
LGKTCYNSLIQLNNEAIQVTKASSVKNETKATYTASVSTNEDQIIAQAISILESRLLRGPALVNSDLTRDYLRLKIGERDHEVFVVVHLDNQHRVTQVEELFRGTIDGCAVYPREVVKSCLLKNTAAVIFAHNHPSGVAEPSQADIKITNQLKAALNTVDVRVLDHVVVSAVTSVSFAERGLL